MIAERTTRSKTAAAAAAGPPRASGSYAHAVALGRCALYLSLSPLALVPVLVPRPCFPPCPIVCPCLLTIRSADAAFERADAVFLLEAALDRVRVVAVRALEHAVDLGTSLLHDLRLLRSSAHGGGESGGVGSGSGGGSNEGDKQGNHQSVPPTAPTALAATLRAESSCCLCSTSHDESRREVAPWFVSRFTS